MTTWTFEPGHTAAEFCVRHMMVTNVRGHFKNVHGTLKFNPESPHDFSVEVTINAKEIWTGEPERDDHLRSADFLDVENYPGITFKGNQVEILGAHDYTVTGDLTIRGVTRQVILYVSYLGPWETPWWEDGEDKGPKTRAGFLAKTPEQLSDNLRLFLKSEEKTHGITQEEIEALETYSYYEGSQTTPEGYAKLLEEYRNRPENRIVRLIMDQPLELRENCARMIEAYISIFGNKQDE